MFIHILNLNLQDFQLEQSSAQSENINKRRSFYDSLILVTLKNQLEILTKRFIQYKHRGMDR